MLEYFAYKKIKKHRADKAALGQVHAARVLKEDDEVFLQRIVSPEGTPPPLPERPRGSRSGSGSGYSTRDNNDNNNSNSYTVDDETGRARGRDKGKGKENEKRMDAKKSSRFSFLSRSRAGNKKACF
jgi:hypothetical protein